MVGNPVCRSRKHRSLRLDKTHTSLRAVACFATVLMHLRLISNFVSRPRRHCITL